MEAAPTSMSAKNARRLMVVHVSKLAREITQNISFIERQQDAIKQRAGKVAQATSEIDSFLQGIARAAEVTETEGKKPKSPEKKPVAKAAPKAQKPVKVQAPAGDRPGLRPTVQSILAKSPEKDGMTAAQIYRELIEHHGKWSRQSLYHTLKNEKNFVRKGEGPEAKYQSIKH